MGRSKIIKTCTVRTDTEKFPPVLYGLKGIMSLFGVSKATACRYKNTILKDAVAQQGKVIVVNTEACLKIWGMANPSSLVNKEEEV